MGILWQSGNLRLQSLTGDDARAYLGEWARLRIEIFAEYPYLYAGDIAGERRYLETYFSSPNARIIGLFDGGHIGGMATMSPLEDTLEHEPDFKLFGLDASQCLYVGDILFEPAYRGLGLFTRCFSQAEQWARAAGLREIVAVAIRTQAGDPMRPRNYRPICRLFARVGLEKLPNATVMIDYPSRLTGGKNKAHPLEYWRKKIAL